MEILTEFYSIHKAEMFSLLWKLFPVILGSEFLARLISSWLDFAGRMPEERKKKLQRALGLTCNLIASMLFVFNFDMATSEKLNLSLFYSGVTMSIHYFVVRPLVEKFDKKRAKEALLKWTSHTASRQTRKFGQV